MLLPKGRWDAHACLLIDNAKVNDHNIHAYLLETMTAATSAVPDQHWRRRGHASLHILPAGGWPAHALVRF